MVQCNGEEHGHGLVNGYQQQSAERLCVCACWAPVFVYFVCVDRDGYLCSRWDIRDAGMVAGGKDSDACERLLQSCRLVSHVP